MVLFFNELCKMQGFPKNSAINLLYFTSNEENRRNSAIIFRYRLA